MAAFEKHLDADTKSPKIRVEHCAKLLSLVRSCQRGFPAKPVEMDRCARYCKVRDRHDDWGVIAVVGQRWLFM